MVRYVLVNDLLWVYENFYYRLYKNFAIRSIREAILNIEILILKSSN